MNESKFWQDLEQTIENNNRIVEIASAAGLPEIYLSSLNDRCKKVCGLYKMGWSDREFYHEIGQALAKL
jgi:hypothetical protein